MGSLAYFSVAHTSDTKVMKLAAGDLLPFIGVGFAGRSRRLINFNPAVNIYYAEEQIPGPLPQQFTLQGGPRFRKSTKVQNQKVLRVTAPSLR